jgi:hypothetical protein
LRSGGGRDGRFLVNGSVSPDEIPGKSVGRRRVGSALDPLTHSKERARGWSEAMKTSFIPKGVYRFNSHEEADEWMWKMISRRKS